MEILLKKVTYPPCFVFTFIVNVRAKNENVVIKKLIPDLSNNTIKLSLLRLPMLHSSSASFMWSHWNVTVVLDVVSYLLEMWRLAGMKGTKII